MRLMNIASSSSGNATYAGSDSVHLLIDSGISKKRITDGLKKLDLSIDDITAVLITHEHSDHISSLGVLERAREIPVYTAYETSEVLVKKGILSRDSGLLNIIEPGKPFCIGDINILPLDVSHDAARPVCYRLSCAGSSMAVVTDLGEYNNQLVENLKDLNALMIEANHDIRMLEAGSYPYQLKMRIAGKRGHLSNETAGRMLSELLNDRMSHIALSHLSPHNNMKELALLSVETEISSSSCGYKASDFRIDIAGQCDGTDIYEF